MPGSRSPRIAGYRGTEIPVDATIGRRPDSGWGIFSPLQKILRPVRFREEGMLYKSLVSLAFMFRRGMARTMLSFNATS